MKAVVYENYGGPERLELREVPEPVPGEDEVLVRVHAAAIGAGDWHMLTATWFLVRLYQGLLRPKRRILGYDLAGRVEAVGARVEGFQPGDAVYGETSEGGTFAELASAPASQLALLPKSLSFEQAAAVPTSAFTALQGLRDHGKLQAGQSVLVNGASGGVGSFAVQIARAFGAEVTGSCSASKADLVRSLGAERVLDYATEDFTERGERYDLILDMVGNRSLSACKRALTPQGVYVAVSGHPLRTAWVGLAGGRRAASFIAKPNRADLDLLTELLESGQVEPVVDRSFALSELSEAMSYFGSGRARGKLVVSVREDE